MRAKNQPYQFTFHSHAAASKGLGDFKSKRNIPILPGLSVVLAALLTAGCGGGEGGASLTPAPPGKVVAFGTDTPLCGVESFVVTITAANLVPQGGGQLAPLITPAAPAAVDFARLADFTNIINTANVPSGNYSQLELTLTNPLPIVIDPAGGTPYPQTVPVTLTATSLTITVSPVLVVSAGATSGLMIDFNLLKSVQINSIGQVTGTVNPQITITPTTASGSTVGEATALYGLVQSVSTTNPPSGFTGSFTLAVDDGTGQTFTILANSGTVFEGDGVTNLSNIAANTFAEVDAIVNTSGQIIAQTIDGEEPTSTSSEVSAYLGEIINVTRDGSGNATGFNLLVDDEVPPLLQDYEFLEGNAGIIHGPLEIAVATTSKYFINWRNWNPQAFTFGPKTLGVAEKVVVFGGIATGPLIANQVFLRPRSVLGNFRNLLAAGSDGVTGGFAMTPCSALFGAKPITVLTYPDTAFNGISGLTALTTAPTLNVLGVFSYEQSSGTANGASWTAPTWIMQAREVHQLPN